MSKRRGAGAAVCLAELVVALCSVSAFADGRPRNVLYMIADDLRPEFNVYSPTTGLHTPNIDQLAREALLFTRACT